MESLDRTARTGGSKLCATCAGLRSARPMLTLRRLVFAVLLLPVLGTEVAIGGIQERAVAADDGAAMRVDPLVVLDDGNESILARPRWVSVDPMGRFVIGDRSDRNLKVYAPDGRRVLTIGRSGGGPGEFASLMSNGVAGDSIVAYDFAAGRLTEFELDGAVVRTLRFDPPLPFKATPADDSTFLLVGHPSRSDNLLRLAGADGAVVRAFFPLHERWAKHPSVLQHAVVFADAFRGLVFAGIFGGRQIRVFNHEGSLLAEAAIDSEKPLRAFYELVEENRGELHRPNGDWVHHGQRMLMSIVAAANSHVAVQVARYDAVLGTDILEGGEIFLFRYSGEALDEIARIESGWGLLGRDAEGRPLVMRYAPASTEKYEIGRLVVPSSTSSSSSRN